ncbi:hypothetical protein [Microseira sp. BLCC-F43]
MFIHCLQNPNSLTRCNACNAVAVLTSPHA